MDQRFGNPVIVAEEYKAKVQGWKQINDGEGKALQELSDFLIHCEEAMKSTQGMCELDSTKVLQSIVAKIPSYIGVKWCGLPHELHIKEEKLVQFKDLVHFVREEADSANDPIVSPDMLKREKRQGIPLQKDSLRRQRGLLERA